MRKFYSVLIDVFIVLIICSIIGIFFVLNNQRNTYANARDNYNSVKKKAVVDASNAWDRKVDFSVVEEKSSGNCSWIYLPNSNIDYPIVQGADNEKYLSMDAYGNVSKSGAIFLDCNNSPELTDAKSVIYGHSMKDGTMFHDLHKFMKKDFAKTHSKLYIYTDTDKVIEYSLLYVLTADCLDENIYGINSSQTVDSFCDYASEKASCVYDENNGNNVLILSTCIKGNSRRVVVFQKSNEQKTFL